MNDGLARRGLVAAAALVVLLCSAPAAHAKTMKQAMSDVASGLVRYCKGRDATRILIKQPNGPADDAATTRMRLELIEALRGELEVVSVRPHVMVGMDYLRNDRSSRYAMTIRVMNSDNMSLGTFNENFDFVSERSGETGQVDVEIDAPADRAVLEGSTFDVSRTAEGVQQPAAKSAIVAALNAPPTVNVAPHDPAVATSPTSVVSASPESPFRIEILTKRDGSEGPYAPRAVENLDGLAYCELFEGEVYTVRIVNDADHSVAVALNVDGINVWHQSGIASWRREGKFVIDPHDSTIIVGWHFGTPQNSAEYREFKVVQYPDTLAAELAADPAAIGQIGAQFHAAWQPHPVGKQPIVEADAYRGPALGTGVGRPTQRQTDEVSYCIGPSILASVTVRYSRGDESDLPPAE